MRINDPIYILCGHLDPYLESALKNKPGMCLTFFSDLNSDGSKFPRDVEIEMIRMLKNKASELLYTEYTPHVEYVTEENWLGYQILTIINQIDKIVACPEVTDFIKLILLTAKNEIMRSKLDHDTARCLTLLSVPQ
jgi:hypothetical protein